MQTQTDKSELQSDELDLEQYQRLAALLQNLPGMVYRCANDAKRSIEFVGGRVLEMTGYRSEELMGYPPLTRPADAIHPEDRERVWNEIQGAVGAGCSYTVEYRLRARDGTLKWVWERGSAVRDAHGAVEALEGFVQDVTERKSAEQKLQLSERLRRLVIETAPECVKIVAADGRLLEMNPAGLAMLEADSLEQAQGCALAEYVVPAHRSAFTDLHHRVMAGAKSALEFEVVGLRGTRRWLETRAVPMRDEDGAVGALLGVTRDVTERRLQSERILRLSRMRAVMSSINALIVRTRSRTELFQEACRIAVEQGGFGLAAIAVRREDGDVVTVALHGDDRGQLAKFRFRFEDESDPAVGSGLRAFRDGCPWVRNDLHREGSVERLREPLRELGYGSSVSYPLMVAGQLQASFNLYAREAGFFDDEEMALLAELAGDLSYALEFIIKDERLDFLSIYDPLTRLPNRTLFLRRLQGFVQSAQGSGRRLALLMLDIERFKAINDTIGHDGGDQLLKLAAERLKFHAGGGGYIARIAGDRFAAVIAEIGRDADVEALVRSGGWDLLDPPFEHGGQEFGVTFKVGVAVYPQDGADPEALLRHAELALKHAKATGQRHARYAAEMGDLASRKLQLGRQLRRALERNEFALHYQPKLDLRTGQICGAEALLRWQSPEQGLVPPGAFVPLMEETGLILEAGRWVLEHAVTQRARWLAEGLQAPRIGVNVSAVQLREKDFVGSVRQVLERVPDAAGGVELEVTESMMMAEPDANIATLRTLRDLGITVSMDDFGTGYSSLGYLARLPLNAVKIDRTFIDRMVHNADTMSIVSSIIALAHSMNLRVVAEGVETDEQCRYLRLLRCDEMQGFLFSPALPAAEFAALLKSGRTLGA